MFLVVLCAVVIGGVLEFYRMQEQKGLHPWSLLGVAASLLWCGAVYWFGVGSLGGALPPSVACPGFSVAWSAICVILLETIVD